MTSTLNSNVYNNYKLPSNSLYNIGNNRKDRNESYERRESINKNKLILPIITNYTDYKLDKKRGKNSILDNETNENLKKSIQKTKPSYYYPLLSENNNIIKSSTIKDKYYNLQSDIYEFQYKTKRKIKKNEMTKEKIMTGNYLFNHPAMNIFMIHPSLMNNIRYQFYSKDSNKSKEFIEEGRNPNENDDVYGGLPIYNDVNCYIDEIKKLKNELIEKNEMIDKLNEEVNKKNEEKKEEKEEKEEEKKEEIPLLKNEISDEEKGKRLKELWRICRGWVNISKYYYIRKRVSKIRKQKLIQMEAHKKDIKTHVEWIIDWFKEVQQKFIDQLLVDSDMNLSFNNTSGKYLIKDKSEKIISLLSLLIKNLLSSCKNENGITARLVSSLKAFTQNHIYLSPKILSTFEINRLEFDIEGRIINLTESNLSMMVIFFLIVKVIINRILLKIHDNYSLFKNYKYISLSMKYFSSILYYIIEEIYIEKSPKLMDILIILNYSFSYKLINEEISLLKDIDIIKNSSIEYKDKNEFINPIQKEGISSFFQMNKSEIEKMKKLIFQFGIQLGTIIREKVMNNVNSNI